MFEDKIVEMNENLKSVTNEDKYVKRVYTVDEIMDILGISKTTAYQLVKSGVFHYVRAGGQIRISKKSFDKWLDQSNDKSDCQMCE